MGNFFMVFPVLLVAGMFGLIVWSVFWAYADAESRGKSGCLVALLVLFLSWPLGLLIWLVFRPNNKNNHQF